MMPATVMAQTDNNEPYAVLSENNKVLTFYYDDQKDARGGLSVGPFESYDKITWGGQKGRITKVVFDDSFANCTTLTSTAYWFFSFTNLTTIEGISNLKTDNVTDMSYMFAFCDKLTNLDLSGFKTDNVTIMSGMFQSCYKLATIYVSDKWTTTNVTKGGMFFNCYSLVGGAGTNFDKDHTDYTYAHIDGGKENPGYFTDSKYLAFTPYAVLSDDNTVLTFYFDDQKDSRCGLNVGPFSNQVEVTWFYQRQSITKVVFDDSFANCRIITSTALWFMGFSSLTTIIGIGNLKTDNVTDMNGMFSACTQLTSLDVSGFNTSKVTNMQTMFNACNKLTSLDVSGFKTDNVTSMLGMFEACNKLTSLDVSGFVTDNVTNMCSMFESCGLTNINVSGFKTDNVTDMSRMFRFCSKLTSIDLSGFKTDSVTNMMSMFESCTNLTSIDLNGFKTDNVTNMTEMFRDCHALTSIDVSGFKTDNVTSMAGMFESCTKLSSLDLTVFKTDKVKFMEMMFSNSSLLNTIYVGKEWSTKNVTQGYRMFDGCTNLVGGVGTTYDAEHTDYTYAHIDEGASNPGYFTLGGVCNLSITATGNGAVTYDNNEIRNNTSIFVVEDGSSATITLSSDASYYVKSMTVNGADVTTSITDNKYTISNITVDTNVEVEFDVIQVALTIKAIGNGSVVYDEATIRENTSNFSVSEGSSITITLNPDEGYRVRSLNVNSTDVTSNIKNNQYTISNINTDTNVEAEFVIQSFTTEGIAYNVVSFDEKTVKVTNGDCGLCANIPSTFTAYNSEWTVIGVEKDAFKSATELAAIIWNPEYKFTASVSNPNLLLFVKSADYAPEDVKNVIVNNKAKSITLSDTDGGNNFYCPQAFTAEQITYVHNYSMKTGFNTSQGWESIVLPFDVALVTNQTGTQLVPYTLWKLGDNTRPFWLYSMNEDGWKQASAIKANTPYVISMPNNENYNATYIQSGDVKFSASNVEVKASDELANSKWGHRILVPNYQTQKSSSDIYALNVNNSIYTYTESDPVEGSAFIKDLRDVGPFEAYVILDSNSSATRCLSIFGDDDTTDIMDLPTSSDHNGNNKVYSLSGRLIKQGKDDKDLQNLPKGVYIINGKKVIK